MGIFWGKPSIDIDKVIPEQTLDAAVQSSAQYYNLDTEGPLEVHGRSTEETGRRIRFVCLSDTHAQHRNIAVPEGDVLIHAGDWTNWRTSSATVADFDDWLGSLPHKHKVVIAGNHELCFKNQSPNSSPLKNAVYLRDSFTQIEGIRIYGAPFTPYRGFRKRANAFTLPVGDMKKVWRQLVPKEDGTTPEVDILVTHVPPRGILDLAGPNHNGCPYLVSSLLKIQPTVHVFGHMHGSQGACRVELSALASGLSQPFEKTRTESTLCINAAQILHFRPIVFDYYVDGE